MWRLFSCVGCPPVTRLSGVVADRIFAHPEREATGDAPDKFLPDMVSKHSHPLLALTFPPEQDVLHLCRVTRIVQLDRGMYSVCFDLK